MTDSKRKRQAKTLRGFRKVHRITGAFLFAVFFFIGVTGLLLGWKKHSGGYILADTQKGQSTDTTTWLPPQQNCSSSNAAAQILSSTFTMHRCSIWLSTRSTAR
jgi:hypothetical protein